MSDINISGIPNMGFAGGGGGYFAPSGIGQLGIGDLGYYNRDPTGAKNAGMVDQSILNSNFGNFGKATDYYSGLGAAYGRATGGFGGGQPAPQAPQQVPIESSVWDTGAQPVPYTGFDMATYLGSLYGGKGGGVSTPAYESRVQSMGLGSGYPGGFPSGYFDPGLYQPSTPPPQPVEDVSSWFNQATGRSGGSSPYPLGGYGGFDPFGGGGGAKGGGGFDMASQLSSLYGGMGVRGNSGFQAAPQLPDIQKLLGYNPATSAQFAPQQNASPFFGAFSNFPNSATPSQYTFQPYTNTQGQTFQPNMPPGFAPEYDVDHPGGAIRGNFNNQAGGA